MIPYPSSLGLPRAVDAEIGTFSRQFYPLCSPEAVHTAAVLLILPALLYNYYYCCYYCTTIATSTATTSITTISTTVATLSF